jgi:HNH endonuclease
MADKPTEGNLRIWKHSHGGKDFTNLERGAYRERSVVTMHRNTKKGQGIAFRTEMSIGDFFYLTHGNDVQLFGQISSVLRKPRAEWVEREYVTIRTLQRRSGNFSGSRKWWTPNFNMTCVKVPELELKLFEKQLLFPFFQLHLRDLEQLPNELARSNELEERVSAFGGKSYEEGLKRLRWHEAPERNTRLVIAAKNAFKRKHGKLFCEVCDFDFSARYGKRGKDYIEAHHLVPISQLTAATMLTIEDLAMVCANCHRMLHQPPRCITLKKLRMLLQPRRPAD